MPEVLLSGRDASTSKHFHIFGHGISFSLSPALHTAGFRNYGLFHTYDIRELVCVDEVAHLIEDDLFGGASVTMPHKLAVHKFCAEQTEHARKIGAINTLVVQQTKEGDQYIIGDNTDWSGLHSIMTTKTEQWPKRPRTGLVIGAGGASRAALYALYKLGVTNILIINRTQANAEKIASDFSSTFHINVVPTFHDLKTRPDIIIGTIPADKTEEKDFDVLFEGASELGLCIDMAYKPRRTPLLAVAKHQPGWYTVPGVEVLLHQAFDQFELWTGLKAPREVMMGVVSVNELHEAEARQRKL